jgi:hypothetical protein
MQYRVFVTGDNMSRVKFTPADRPPDANRREFLTVAALATVALAIPTAAATAAAPPEDTRLVLHKGWVLRADDLPRLTRA